MDGLTGITPTVHTDIEYVITFRLSVYDNFI